MAYVQSCQARGISQKTIDHYVSDVRRFHAFLISEGMLKQSPAGFIKTRGIKRRVYHTILSPAELQQLYRQYPVDIAGEPGKNMPPQERNILSRKRNKIIVNLLVNQGLRVEEIKALTVQDLQLREGQMTVHSQRRTAERVLELESYQVYELMDYLQAVRKPFIEASGPSDRLFLRWRQGEHFYSVTGAKRCEKVPSAVITEIEIILIMVAQMTTP